MEAPIQSSSVDGHPLFGSHGSTSAVGAEGTSSEGALAPPVATTVLTPTAQTADGSEPSPGLTVQSGTVTNVSSLLVKTESITAVPALNSGLSASAPEPPQTLPTVPHTVEINPEALVASMSAAVSLPPPAPVALPSSSLTLGGSVTGTGSVTATPTAYTTAVMTTATTTTSTTVGQSAGPLLGKRVRRQSSKYEDYEQQTATVCDWCRSVSGDVHAVLLSCLQKSVPVQDTPAKSEKKMTNQLQFLLKATRALWRHHYAWPFHKPVDPVTLNLPVSYA
jgi:hypothetical protein